MAELAGVPDAVFARIFALLAPSARPAVRLVCRHWYQLAAGVPNFWAHLHIELWTTHWTTTPDAVRVLCQLLTAQGSKGMLRRVEIAALEGASLLPPLLSLAGGSLQHLNTRSCALSTGELQAISSLQGLCSLGVCGVPEDIGPVIHTPELQFLSSLTALRSLSMEACFQPADAGLPMELTRLAALTHLRVSYEGPGRLVLSKSLLRGLSHVRSLYLGDLELQHFSSQDAVEVWQHLVALRMLCVEPQALIVSALPRLPRLTAFHFDNVAQGADPAVLDAACACLALLQLSSLSCVAQELPLLAPRSALLAVIPVFDGREFAAAPASLLVPHISPGSGVTPEVQVVLHAPEVAANAGSSRAAALCSTFQGTTMSRQVQLCVSLQELRLWRCSGLSNPEAWPVELSRLIRLHTLDLTAMYMHVLPQPLLGLSSLTALLLGCNNVETLRDGPYLSNLRRLSLAGNCLAQIPSVIATAAKVTELDLSYCTGLSLQQEDLSILRRLRRLGKLSMFGPDSCWHGLSAEELVLALRM